MTRLDGNAIAGELFEIFGEEMTAATGSCAGCGSTRPLGELAVYLQAPDGRPMPQLRSHNDRDR